MLSIWYFNFEIGCPWSQLGTLKIVIEFCLCRQIGFLGNFFHFEKFLSKSHNGSIFDSTTLKSTLSRDSKIRFQNFAIILNPFHTQKYIS